MPVYGCNVSILWSLLKKRTPHFFLQNPTLGTQFLNPGNDLALYYHLFNLWKSIKYYTGLNLANQFALLPGFEHLRVFVMCKKPPSFTRSSAVTGWPCLLLATTILPRRSRMSRRLVVSARTAMISLATVMSNWHCKYYIQHR